MYIRGISNTDRPVAFQPKPQETRNAFTDAFQKTSSALAALDKDTIQSQLDLVMGNARDMHTAVLSAEKASLALDLVISVRNRALEAYQEIMRMPL